MFFILPLHFFSQIIHKKNKEDETPFPAPADRFCYSRCL